MFLNLRPKTKAFFHLLQAYRPAVFFPVLIVLILLGVLAVSTRSATPGSANPYLAEELPLPVLPVPFSPDELQYFEDAFTDFLQRQRFNGTVLVARNGMIIYRRAFGYANYRSRTPLNEDTPFQLASISKTFTATAVLMLQEDGRIQIDDPLVKYIPEFPYPDMTIRHLLNHTSGIQNYMWLVERYWHHDRLPDNEDILDLFIRYRRPVDFAAGTRFGYSNTGYAFLALLIERVSGQQFADFLREKIFEPLEMHNTFAYNPGRISAMPDDRAFGYRPGRSSFLLNQDQPHDGVMGDKGIYSSVNDLYKWDQAIYRYALLSPTTWDQAFQPTVLRNQRTVDYGQGWRLQTYLDKRIVHHPGRWNGFRTSFKRFIDNQATIILLSNNGRDISPVVEGMQNILFHKEILMFTEKPAEEMSAYEEESYGN